VSRGWVAEPDSDGRGVDGRDARRALSELDSSYGDHVLRPLVPERVIVREARAAGRYYGFFGAGAVVHDAYMTIARKVLDL